MRCISGKLARYILERFHLLWAVFTYLILDRLYLSEDWVSSRTWHVSCVHETWRDSHEQDALAFIKSTVFGNCDIQSRFTDGVRSSYSQIDLVDQIDIRHACRQRKDFLFTTLAKERDEDVDGVDHTDDIDIEADLEILDESLGIIGATMRCSGQHHTIFDRHGSIVN